jgi:hypothetical protein
MEKFERLFRLYKINYRIADTNYIDEKFVVSDNTFIKFKFLFIKNQDNDINDIEYLLSCIYKNIKNYQKNKINYE